jgi:hypothetical protein
MKFVIRTRNCFAKGDAAKSPDKYFAVFKFVVIKSPLSLILLN